MPRKFRDALGRELYVGPPPGRVVSLVPSETHNLFALGLGDRVVGRTDFCVEPADAVADIPTVGGTKDAEFERIAALEPDLVIANQEENSRPVLEKLAQERFRVFVSFPKTVPQAIAHLAELARIFQVEAEPTARDLIRRGYGLVRGEQPEARRRAFVPIWMKPLMTFRDQTYAHDVLAWAGLDNCFADRARMYPLKADLGSAEPMTAEEVGERDTRYPRVSLHEVADRRPEVILLPDEPHEFSQADAEVFRDLGTGAAIHMVSGKDLFWPGAQSIDGLERLRRLAAG